MAILLVKQYAENIAQENCVAIFLFFSKILLVEIARNVARSLKCIDESNIDRNVIKKLFAKVFLESTFVSFFMEN